MSGRQATEDLKSKNFPLVSIVCITYNHEPYIIDAIEGFLMQKTDFPFEVIIQDDASTDKTPEIIAQYAKKYPTIIKPIYHTENQYSQNKKNVFIMAASHAIGKYIACCEGDDYWIDEKKLQTQISEMQKHPNCDISAHPVVRTHENQQKKNKVVSQHAQNNKIFKTEELILGSASFCPMASIIFKASVFQSIPKWIYDAPVEDYFLQILGALNGGALYINKVMAVYRIDSSGSWSERMSRDEGFVYDYFTRMLKSLEDINLYTQNKYTSEFTTIKNKICFFMSINPVLPFKKRKEIFLENKNKFNFKHKLMWHLIFKKNKIAKLVFYVRNYIIFNKKTDHIN